MTHKFSDSDPRLTHSTRALKRLAQMEDAEVVVYVEGVECDLAYYSRVTANLRSSKQCKLAFRPSREIPGGGEGKSKCLAFHSELQNESQLISTVGGKRTVLGFILDKDVDDLSDTLLVSRHICYTVHCCVENHIVLESDLAAAISAATFSDLSAVRVAIGDQSTWTRAQALKWREWTALCMLAKTLNCGAKGYGYPSTVNDKISQATNPIAVQSYLDQLANRGGLNREEIAARYEATLATYDRFANEGKVDKLFKGKWYSIHIASLAKNTLKCTPNSKATWAALTASVQMNHKGSAVFRRFLVSLAKSR